jgi:uridine phosphorylase
MRNSLGPNTNAPRDLLASDVIICAGEDPNELAQAINGIPLVEAPYSYRCYRFWKSPTLTVIWTGIGTGCLEPLLYEILSAGIVKRVCLVGTAGTIRPALYTPGTPCWIESAYSLGMSIDNWVGPEPIHPRWEQPILPNAPRASIVSTDFYYITSPAGLKRFESYLPVGYADRYRERTDLCDMIDMETAAFFFFCQLFGQQELIEFVAVKGASNSVEHKEEQVMHSANVVLACIHTAIGRWANEP